MIKPEPLLSCEIVEIVEQSVDEIQSELLSPKPHTFLKAVGEKIKSPKKPKTHVFRV